MSFSLQFSALRRQLSVSIEAVLRSAHLKCCGNVLEVSFQPRLLTGVRGRGWSRLKIDLFKAKVSGRVKTKPRTSPFVLVCRSLSHLSLPLAYHDLSIWAGGAESTHLASGKCMARSTTALWHPRDAAEPVVGRLCHWWSWRNSGHSLPPSHGPKQESHRAGEFISLAFSSAEVIGSDQWGKQKLLSSFLTPWEGCSLYMMWLQLPDWCVYFTATALSTQSRVTQQLQQQKFTQGDT